MELAPAQLLHDILGTFDHGGLDLHVVHEFSRPQLQRSPRLGCLT